MTDDPSDREPRPGSYVVRDTSLPESHRLLLFMDASANRRLLEEWLADDYEVTVADSPAALATAFDLCIIDTAAYHQYHDQISDSDDDGTLTFRPVLLTTTPDSGLRSRSEVWTLVDDVVEVPVPQAELRARLESLLEQRAQSLRLRERETQLEELLSELRAKERAMEAAPVGITICDVGDEDNPIQYVNRAFEELTGYTEAEVLGRDCRLLQGANTAAAPVAAMRDALDAERPVSVEVQNQGKNGRQFWNRVDIAPVQNERGDVTQFVGFQTDVTERKIREQRLGVLNRILRHNLRNGMSIVLGYCEQLEDHVSSPQARSSLDAVASAAADLTELSEKVHDIDSILQQLDDDTEGVNVVTALRSAIADVESTSPQTSVNVEVSSETLPLVPQSATVVFQELVRNVLEDCDGTVHEPTVTVARSDDSTDTIVVEVTDYQSRTFDPDREVLAAGEETPLHHADGMGLWLANWVVSAVGGAIELTDPDAAEPATIVRLPTV